MSNPIRIDDSTQPATKEQMPEAGGERLGSWDSVQDEGISYRLTIPGSEGFAFLFGFQGRGCNYRLDVSPGNRIAALYQRCDGILLYLHHVCLELSPKTEITVLWHVGSIRVKVNDFCVMNVIVNGPTAGHRGFASIGTAYEIPRLQVDRIAAPRFEWICLGDGFSNNRWPHRHFVSWPEILFGDRDTCLNAAVAAGNTHRVLDVVRSLGATVRDATIVVASGTDDMIEGETFDACAARLKTIVARLRDAGAGAIHLCTLPPRQSFKSATATWSEGIRRLAASADAGVLDFHEWLSPNASAYMAGGDFPNADAQRFLAGHVGSTLGLSVSGRHPATFEPEAPGGELIGTLAYKVSRKLERWTLDFPGMLRS